MVSGFTSLVFGGSGLLQAPLEEELELDEELLEEELDELLLEELLDD